MGNFYEENKEFLPKEETQTVPSKVKAGVMSYLPSALLTLVLVALSGLGTLIQVNFEIKAIVWTSFFISLGLRLISNFLSKYVGSNLSYNKALYSEEVQSLKSDFLLQSKKIDKCKFEKYVSEINLQEKKEAYKVQKHSKIVKLNKKIDFLEHANELECSKRKEKKIKKLNNKVSVLKTFIAEDYVDKNIKYIKVKYFKLQSCYFLSPAEDSSEKKKLYNVNFSKENTIEISKSLPLTVMLIFFGTLIGHDFMFGQINVISVLFDIATMAFNFIVGWFIVGKRIISKTMNAYINRLTFIEQYMAENNNKN